MDEKTKELMKNVKDIDKTKDREKILALIKQRATEKEFHEIQPFTNDVKKRENYLRYMFYTENPKFTLWKEKTIDRRLQLHAYDRNQRNIPFPERDWIEALRFPAPDVSPFPVNEEPNITAQLRLRSIVNNNMNLLSARTMEVNRYREDQDPSRIVIKDPAINLALMDQSVTIVLSSHGYKGIESSALEVFSSVIINYLGQFGKTVRSFMDIPGTTDTLPEIIGKAFAVTDPNALMSLDSFFSNDNQKSNLELDLETLRFEHHPVDVSETSFPSVLKLNPSLDGSETSTPSKKISPKRGESRKRKTREDKIEEIGGSPFETSSPAINTRSRRRTRSATAAATTQRKPNTNATADQFIDNEDESTENEGFSEPARKKRKRTVGRKTRKKVI